ncbi:MAG: tRNA pseudouridine(13) synthase TruD [Nitrospirae bacterium]|nr:tRNA pseudouridine(13) synthase TruD [Nitrospirota bacterium]
MKIKVQPEDFIVEEVAHLPLKKKGTYRVYLLEKKNWNTVDLLIRLSRAFKIPLRNLSYGGKKDRYGLTRQYITVKNNDDISHKDRNYSLSFIGFMDRPMGPDLIEANKFSIVVRDIHKNRVSTLEENIEKLSKEGMPNYFDDQRFGSFDPKGGFIAEKIIKKHYNGALKIYLTHVYPGDKAEEKKRKRIFYEHWGDWKACLRRSRTEFERLCFHSLLRNEKAFLPLLHRIPREEMSLYFSAYQSYLWNEVLRRLIKRYSVETKAHRGIAGDYVFYTVISGESLDYLKNLSIPTVASRMEFQDELTEHITEEILKEHGIKRPSFNLRTIRQARFTSFLRKAIVFPEGLTWSFHKDTIYKDKLSLKLSFSLLRGGYATMLIKRISL